jgi:hypothetical protein
VAVVRPEESPASNGSAPVGTQTVMGEGARLNHMPHGELPCDLGEALSGCLGSGNRRRGELDGGGPAAAAGTRVSAIVLLDLLNKRPGKVLWCTRKSLGARVSEEGDWKGVHTGRR